jgi:heptosyltransferase-1
MIAPQAFGLAEWMQVLRAAAVVVGVDTGLLYLAAAVGTPAVAIYTGSSPHSVEFESAGPWRSLGESGQPPAAAAVIAATQSVLQDARATPA